MAATCTHLEQIRSVEPRTPDGCEECLQTGDRWVHLRLCLACGHVGCCDSSLKRHATRHFRATGHPIVRSFEPDEDWSWCYVDRVVLEPSDVERAAMASGAAANMPGAVKTETQMEMKAEPETKTKTEPEPASAGGPGGLLSRMLGFAHPRNYVVGVIDDEEAAERAADALRRDGFAPEDVVLRSGTEIAERLRREDIGNLVREATTEEGSICRDYDELARDGEVISVYTSTHEQVERVGRIMAEHGGHALKHFGDWTISDLRPAHR